MEYSLKEKNILDLIEKTNFKNLSKNDVINFASKITELRPEVAKEILAKFPDFVDFMKSTLTDSKEIFDKIISSDDSSIKEYYNIINRVTDSNIESREQFYNFLEQIRRDHSKILDDPNSSPEIKLEILNREIDLAKIAFEKDTEIRQQEKEIEDNVNKKDSEKREYNWKLIGGICLVLIVATGISASILGGNFNLNLPKKKFFHKKHPDIKCT